MRVTLRENVTFVPPARALALRLSDRAGAKREAAARAWRVTKSLGWLLQQAVEIEPLREHGQLAVRGARPLLVRFIPIEFHAVLVGVAQVKRLAHAMVRGAVEGYARRNQPAQRIGERGAGRVVNGCVVEPRRARRG